MVEEVTIPVNSRPTLNAYSMRGQGVLLILISAAVFSSAGLFVKGVAADSWTILFWRGLSATTFTLIGGMIVLLAVFGSQLYALWRKPAA